MNLDYFFEIFDAFLGSIQLSFSFPQLDVTFLLWTPALHYKLYTYTQ